MPEDEEDEVYEFVAGGGENTCERCMAMNGSQWPMPPNQPHAHCECEVVVRPRYPRTPRENCEDTTWSFSQIPHSGAYTYGEGSDEGFEWGYNVTIDCWDGGSYEFEIWLDMGKLSDWPMTDTFEQELEGYVWDQLYDDVEAVIARVCRPCTPQLVS